MNNRGERVDAGVPVRVVKFGGTSVSGGGRIETIERVVRGHARASEPVLVVSAFARVTNLLEEATRAARRGALEAFFAQLVDIHEAELRSMTSAPSPIAEEVGRLLAECRVRLAQISETGSCSLEVLDDVLSFGERLSTTIVAAGLTERGVPAVPVDARNVVVTDEAFGAARADLAATRVRLAEVLPRDRLPVVTGFLGGTPDGRRTTLGREGSDYSAAVLGWVLRAEAVEIWTDVDGVMTADPRVVPDARPHRHLAYHELFTFAEGGAKVVHPRTVAPLRELGIPLTVRSTIAPSAPGTRVGPERQEHANPDEPLGVAARTEADGSTRHAIVTAIGSATTGLGPERIEALRAALASAGVEVLVVENGQSGRVVSFTVAEVDQDTATRALHAALFGHPSAPAAGAEAGPATESAAADAVRA